MNLSSIDDIQASTMIDFITNCTEETLKLIDRYLSNVAEGDNYIIRTDQVEIISPIPRPVRNVICLGLNYHEHALESQRYKGNNFTMPDAPVYFSKMASYAIGSGQEIESHQHLTERLDYEVELAVIIGKEGSNISEDEVENYIFGYSILNDVTARDLQKEHTQWLKGKSLDTFTVFGPAITHRSAIPFPVELVIQSEVNGEIRQSSNTSKLIFDIPYIISNLSKGLTLRAGDIIATGTPEGVGMGFDPPRFLQSGDTVTCTIESIGILANTVK